MPVDYEGLFETVKRNIFAEICNYTQVTLKNNIRLTIMNKGLPVRGMIMNNVISALMPDTNATYYLFMCSNLPISNLLFTANKWENFEDVLNFHQVNADIVTADNKMLPKRMVYGKCGHSGSTLIAIDARTYSKFNTVTETYLVINADTDTVGDRTVISHLPGIHENISALLTAAHQHQSDQMIGFVNGYAYRNDVFTTTGNPLSDYYELYIDEDVKFTFTVDLTQRNTYMCSDEHIYKDVVVIPQNFISGRVYTYDTITLIVRTSDGKGVYLPFIAQNSISQITHTSFSVASYLIDAAFDKLGVTDGELCVIVSDFSKDHFNMSNGGITEELYRLDDSTIMSSLMNRLDPKIPYWTADTLEKSMYAKYLVDMTELDTYSKPLIKNEIECLGYYSFVKSICQHTGEFSNLGSNVSTLNIIIPEFWKNADIYPVLYLDGNKLPYSLYTANKVGSDLVVTFGTPLPINFSYSVIQYDLILKPEASSYACTANQNLQTVEVLKLDNEAIRVFMKDSGTTSEITHGAYLGYKEIPFSNNQYFSIIDMDGSYIISFNEYAFSNEFVIMRDSVTTVNIHTNLDISNGKSLVFVPTCSVVGETYSIIILTEGSYDVYLNGKYLVEGIDYMVDSIKNSDGTLVGGYAIVLQNLKFLLDTSPNTVEVYRSNRHILTSDTGYVVGGIIPRNENNEAWIRGVSKLFINGKLVPFDCVVRTNTHYEIDDRYWKNGYIYQFTNQISRDFYDAYSDSMDDGYFTGRHDINAFFTNGYSYTYPSPLIISDGNKIFSSYLNEIILRIVAGEIIVNYINDDNDIIHQLVQYDSLKRFDVLFANPNKIDKRFIDVYPGYIATISISDLNHYMYIQRLVKILLGSDTITDHLVVYTGQ